MGFYFTNITGWKSFVIKGKNEEFKYLFLSELQKEIKDSAIFNVKENQDRVFFKAPIFRFVWNGWNRFNPVSYGIFQFSSIKQYGIVRYRLWFWEFFILSLIFSTIPFIAAFPSLFWRITIFIVIWAVYLINILVSVRRIENYLLALADEINSKF